MQFIDLSLLELRLRSLAHAQLSAVFYDRVLMFAWGYAQSCHLILKFLFSSDGGSAGKLTALVHLFDILALV